MSSKYSAQKASALSLITRKGQAVSIFKVKLDDYDPLNPADGGPTVDNTATGVAVVLPATTSTISQFDTTKIEPQRVKNYRYLIVAGQGLAFDLEINDIIRTTTEDLQVNGLRKLDPDGGGAIIWMVLATTDTNIVP